MKKSLLFSTCFCLCVIGYVLPVDAANCSCAGRCSTGARCNCATGACSVPSRYAYGYVDTAVPVAYAQPVYQNYQMPTPYRTSEPPRKYSVHGTRPYVATRLGVNFVEGKVKYTSTEDGSWSQDFDGTVLAGALAFGTKMNEWRMELEGSLYLPAKKTISFSDHSFNNSFKTEADIKTLLFNVFYDIPTNTQWTPFVGAGIGLSHITGKIKGYDRDDGLPFSESHKKANFAWQIGAGISYALSGTVNLDFAYRYTHYGKAKLQAYSGCDPVAGGGLGNYVSDHTNLNSLTSHALLAGLRFNF